MPIDLTDFERGAPFAGDYQAVLSALQDRLARAQLSQIVHRKRAIVLIEGWDGAGKRGALKKLAGAWDPCQLATYCLPAEGSAEDDRHWLAPFWSRLPAAGHSAIFYRSWYRQMIERRVAGDLDDRAWARAADEVNEFESQQCDHGTLVVKLFFHVSAAVQAERLRERAEDPWRRVLVGQSEAHSAANRGAYEQAWSDVFAQTDTRWAPWTLIDAGDKYGGRIAALTELAERFEKAMPLAPPKDDATVVYLDKKKRA